jgi:hypothetical protein
VVVGKITSLNTWNRVGIEPVIGPDGAPPEFMVIVTVDVVTVGDTVPIVLVGIETCMTGAGVIGAGIIGAGIIPMEGIAMASNCRPSSDSTEIEGFRRACRTFIACRFCSCWDLMGLFLCEL